MIDILPLDLADDEVLAGAFEVETAATKAVRPGWAPLPVETRIGRWRDDSIFSTRLIGAHEDGALLGLGAVSSYPPEPERIWFSVHVHPDHWRRGIGTRLVQAMERELPVECRSIVSGQDLADQAAADALASGFCEPLGYRCGTRSLFFETNLADRTWGEHPAPEGWRVETHVDGVPEELREELGILMGKVDAEAPSGEIEWQERAVTPQEYQSELDAALREGTHVVEAIALNAEGRIGAWTSLHTAPAPYRPAMVGATLVLEEYRGQRLGLAIKAAIAQTAAELSVTRLQTESDEANRWMHAVNRQLGFRECGVSLVVQKLLGS